MDQRSLLPSINVPTLVIGGDEDVSLPWNGHGDVLASQNPRRLRVEDRGSASLQPGAPVRIHKRGAGLPASQPPAGPSKSRLRCPAGSSGRHTRRSRNRQHERFYAEFQELITRYAWGTIWTRPGLDPAIRRLLVLAVTAALGRWEEFRLHVRTGLAAELEPEELREVLLQTSVYAGVPAANSGFHIATEELTAQDPLKTTPGAKA